MGRSKLKIAAAFYGLVALVALIFAWVRDSRYPNLFFHPESLLTAQALWVQVLVGGAAGVAFGMGIARLSRVAVHRLVWARDLHTEFRALFGPLRNVEILAFSAFSAVGEELLFRGALQTSFGIVIASVIFGVLHIGPSRKFLPWPFQATAMGFAFGALFWLTGTLAAPIMAHFTINYENLHFINRYDPTWQLPKGFGTPDRQL